jgi:TRAP-type C4-dicarboxylate transport system permease large subunit
MKSILPFYSALFAVMLVVTYIPGFSTWIPSLLKGAPVY